LRSVSDCSFFFILVLILHRCQFKGHEKATVAFPIYHGWSKAKIEVTARHYAPFPIERIDFDRHRFALLDSLSERMDGDWVLCVMEAPDSGQISGKWMVTFPGGKRYRNLAYFRRRF
jgi:hypothetical protein